MTKSEYAEVLKGARWQKLREEHLAYQSKCEKCEIPRWLAVIAYDQDLHVHHCSYARIGTEEELYDLQTLCRRCHEIATFKRSDLRAPKTAACSICKSTHWDPRSDYCSLCLGVLAAPDRLSKFRCITHPDFTGGDGVGPTVLDYLGYRLSHIYGEDGYLIHIARRFVDNMSDLLDKTIPGFPNKEATLANLIITGLWLDFGTDALLDALALISKAKAGEETNRRVVLFGEPNCGGGV